MQEHDVLPPPAPREPSSVARRVVVAVVGSTIILFGVAMLVLPGPGVLTIGVGLALLATEFVWAARLLKRMKDKGGELAKKAGIGKKTG